MSGWETGTVSLVQLCNDYSGLLRGSLLPCIHFNALTLLVRHCSREPATATVRTAVQLFFVLLRSEPIFFCRSTHTQKKKERCFPLKEVGGEKPWKALCSEEEMTSSVFRCLQQWQLQSHPEWLMSRQAGCEEQSTSPDAELAVGIPQGEGGCCDMAEDSGWLKETWLHRRQQLLMGLMS